MNARPNTDGNNDKKIIDNSRSKKKYAISVKKSQLIAFFGVVFVGCLVLLTIVIPVMNGSLHFLTVLSGSMTPAISPGDIVVSQYIDPDIIEVEDIITFQHAEQDDTTSITHRVINISTNDNQRVFYTKGDANENPDLTPITSEDVIGKVVLVIPLLGYLVNFAQSFTGFILLIAIPAIILIVGEIRNLLKISKD
jgi:signal peptidase